MDQILLFIFSFQHHFYEQNFKINKKIKFIILTFLICFRFNKTKEIFKEGL